MEAIILTAVIAGRSVIAIGLALLGMGAGGGQEEKREGMHFGVGSCFLSFLFFFFCSQVC